jgi:hypothetical protein
MVLPDHSAKAGVIVVIDQYHTKLRGLMQQLSACAFA